MVKDITPEVELYDKSPPAEIADLALAFVKYKLDEPSLKSSVSLLDKLSSVAAIVSVLAESS